MKKYIALFLIIGLASCKNAPAPSSAEYIIHADSLSTELPPMKNVRYIPLETTEASFIKHIDKVIVRDNIYYIFDNLNQRILLFNDAGKFIRSIDKLGAGPGEYLYPSDMNIDEEGNLYVSDFPSKKIIKYKSGNENDFEVLPIGESFMDFIIQGQYIYLSRLSRTGAFDINLARWDMNSQEVEILKKNELIEGNNLGFSPHYFYRTGNNQAFYYERFRPILYQIAGDTLREYISYTSATFPTDEAVRRQSKLPMEKIGMGFSSWDVSACYETEKYLLMQFVVFPPSASVCSLVNKVTKEVYSTTSLLQVIDYKLCASTGKEFVFYFNPIDANVKQIEEMEMDEISRERVANLSMDDNPVLVLFSFD